MIQQSEKKPTELRLFGQLVVEWTVGVAIKNVDGQIASGLRRNVSG
jgi:hypothetical protein